MQLPLVEEERQPECDTDDAQRGDRQPRPTQPQTPAFDEREPGHNHGRKHNVQAKANADCIATLCGEKRKNQRGVQLFARAASRITHQGSVLRLSLAR